MTPQNGAVHISDSHWPYLERPHASVHRHVTNEQIVKNTTLHVQVRSSFYCLKWQDEETHCGGSFILGKWKTWNVNNSSYEIFQKPPNFNGFQVKNQTTFHKNNLLQTKLIKVNNTVIQQIKTWHINQQKQKSWHLTKHVKNKNNRIIFQNRFLTDSLNKFRKQMIILINWLNNLISHNSWTSRCML